MAASSTPAEGRQPDALALPHVLEPSKIINVLGEHPFVKEVDMTNAPTFSPSIPLLDYPLRSLFRLAVSLHSVIRPAKALFCLFFRGFPFSALLVCDWLVCD
jgi:hypothetical protein